MNRQIEELLGRLPFDPAESDIGVTIVHGKAEVTYSPEEWCQIKELLKGLFPQGGEYGELAERLNRSIAVVGGAALSYVEHLRHSPKSDGDEMRGADIIESEVDTLTADVREAADAIERLSVGTGLAGELRERITEYLSLGGLHNPEAMDHDKVRDLLIDCRDAFERAAHAPKEGWVRCSERLPEPGVRVLVYDWKASVYKLDYTVLSIGGEYQVWCNTPDEFVHYWMPIPPAPTQEGEER